MKYYVTVGGRTMEVDVMGERVRLDGAEIEAQLVSIPRTPLRRLVLGSVAHTLALLPAKSGWVVESAGTHWAVDVVDERTRQLEELAGGPGKGRVGGILKAPMPGLVLRVEVEEGQIVEAGTGVVVLEAMKMENEIKAPAPGVVKVVHVSEGQAVDKGVPLVEITEP